MDILAIGAHPDDVELGCGGLLIKAARQGHKVHIYTLTRGGASGDAAQRAEESRESARFIGAKLWLDDFPDTGLSGDAELIGHIEARIDSIRPDLILTHHLRDSHHDHRAVATPTAFRSHFVTQYTEIRPGTYVFNYETFTRARALGGNLSVNLDPSHFFWQSIDPLAMVPALGGCVAHVHGKDTTLNEQRLSLNGVLDTRWPNPPDEMPWNFATVGRGHDKAWWRNFVGLLQDEGFEGTISIEYEDPFVGAEESILESAKLLSEVISG